MSPTLKSTGSGSRCAKIWEEGVDRCQPNFNTIWETRESVVCKKILVDIFSHLSTMHERNGQTNTKTNQQIDRPRNRKIDDNRPRRNRLPLPAMSPINGSMIREWCNAI